MNVEIEEIINAVYDLLNINFVTLFSAVVGIMASFLTLVGSSLSKIFAKLLDIRNWKTVKYVICNECKNYTFNLIAGSLVFLYSKFFYYVLFPMIFLCFFIGMSCSASNYMRMISIQIVLVIFSRFIAKRSIKNKNTKYKIFALFFSLLAVLQVFLLSLIFEYFLYIIVVIGYAIIDCAILVCVYAHIKNKAVLWVAIPRHLIFYFVFFLLLYSNVENILPAGAIIWSILIIVELPIYIISGASITPVSIHTVEGVKITKSRIMQYECDKVMYKLEDGTTEIVDQDTILYMSCITPAGFRSIKYKVIDFLMFIGFKKFSMKYSSVECLFNGKELKELQTYEIIKYKYINESWIRLEVKHGDYKLDIIVNANRVKKIICQDKKPLYSISEQ